MTKLICGDHELLFGARTYIMGVVNVTPDSFSDGGCFIEPSKAIEHGLQLMKEGADILDVGGMATSSYTKSFKGMVSEEEELARVVPVVAGLKKNGISAISVDTMRATVAQQALLAGASWINDQSAGLFDPAMPQVMATASAVVLMHNGGGDTSGVYAGEHVTYDNIWQQICVFFAARIATLEKQGVKATNIILDPGIGFGKGLNDSLAIINGMGRLKSLSQASLIGISRKSFLAKIIDAPVPKDRDYASLGATAMAMVSGVSIIRTHNVKAVKEMAQVVDACLFHKESSNENLYQTR